jgi:hypothetical protein
MAPEQISAMRTGKDARTDVYQSGLLLYELLTFRRAYASDERHELLEAVRAGKIRSPRQVRPDIPPELADICMRATERNPEHRYPTADAFRDDLERWLGGLMPAAARLGAAGRGWRQVRNVTTRHRWAVLAVCLLALSAGTTAWLALRPPALSWRQLAADLYDVSTRDGGTVCAWLHSVDGKGVVVATVPLRLQLGAQRAHLQVRLPAGTTSVRIVEQEDCARLPDTKQVVRWKLAEDDLDAAWLKLAQRALEVAQLEQQPVPTDRLRQLAAELREPGRGGAGNKPLPLDDLLR